jgi:CRISPR-associated endonuclease Csn1
MKLRLSLDMGTNSIGWAAFLLDNDKLSKLLNAGVRIFSDGREAKTGVPLNEARRAARQMRKQRERKNRRKLAMLHYLVSINYLPASKDERIAYLNSPSSDPYTLRKQGLERKLEKAELARVLMHFAVRRGFKSNRKEQQAENNNEQAGMLAGVKHLEDILKGKTLGEWLFERRSNQGPVRFRPIFEKTKVIYPFYPSRAMYEEEFNRLKERQQPFHKEINWDRVHWFIFFQRPLKRPERGHCQFYANEYRAFKAQPSAARFRILQDINNLKYYDGDNNLQSLNAEQKEELYQRLETCKSLSFESIRNKLFKNADVWDFNLESERRSGLLGNEVSYTLRQADYFGEVWDKLSWEEQDQIVETLIVEDDENAIKTSLAKYQLNQEQIVKILGYNFKTGTTMLSSKFQIDCSRVMLEKWLPYHEAVQELGLHHSLKKEHTLRKRLPYYGKELVSLVAHGSGKEGDSDEIRYGRISNPTVHIALNQLRKLCNALVRRYGNPSSIIMEIGRDLKNGKDKKREIEKQQTENQKQNERVKAELISMGFIAPSREDIKKFLLWEELSKDSMARRCPYCGGVISAQQLFSGDIEIEHILPYSRTLLDSRDNLTVAHRGCNQFKKEQSPYEAFGSSPTPYDWNLIIELSKNFTNASKRRKFDPDAMKRFDDEENGFLKRQLTDNAYLAKAASEYLSVICNRNAIIVTPGKITAKLRGYWGLNTILNDGKDSWFKNRDDHRHHALDAIVIGLNDRAMIAEMAKVNARKGYHELVAPPCPIERETIEKAIATMIVSHKQDHGKEGKLFAETALGKRSKLIKIKPEELEKTDIGRIIPKGINDQIVEKEKTDGFRKAKAWTQSKYAYLMVFRDRWVTSAPLTSLSARDIDNICNEGTKKKIKDYLETHPDLNFEDALKNCGEETGIRKLRYFPKDQVPLFIASCNNKAYMPNDFFRADVWEIPGPKKKTFEATFISRTEAYTAERTPDFIRRKPHPAAKFVMSLYKNDIIEISEQNGLRPELCIIAGYSTTRNNVDIQPIYSTNTIQGWKENTNQKVTSAFWPIQCKGQFFKSINTLFSEYTIQKVKVSVDGRLIRI